MRICEKAAKESGVPFELWGADKISTYKGGGEAFVFLPNTLEEFAKVYAFLKGENADVFILGGGSNVIVKDGLCSKICICTSRLNKIKITENRVECECGAQVSNVIKRAREKGLGGLEFLSGVPCTAGGAVRMNAGAFSSQIGDYISKIDILTCDNANCDTYTVKQLCKDDLRFSYRKGIGEIVLRAEFSLEKTDEKTSLAATAEYLKIRRQRQPCLPSCGSVFKNGDVPSGKLIEECGLKGKIIGGAQISDKHANFIVNVKGGSAADYLALVNICENAVKEKFGVELQREFVVLD